MRREPTKVLVAPLDWGLGHATRCIPIIRYLAETGRQVIIAADDRPLKLLEAEFPNLPIVPLPGYDILYPNSGSMTVAMARQFPKILRAISRENKWLKAWADREKPALIISDNRFGLFHNTVPSIYITHQLNIKTPARVAFLQPLLATLHNEAIERFTECWIPDYETPPGLAGDLSHSSRTPRNAKYIGPLSRFVKSPAPIPVSHNSEDHLDLIAILSGPEPQRSIFEELILSQLPKTKLKALVIAGRSEEDSDEWITDRVRLVSRMTSTALKEAIDHSTIVLARPGYSTVMDLAVLGKRAIFVPTPGQTEQEYLGETLRTKSGYFVVAQDRFNLAKAWQEIQSYAQTPEVTGEFTSFIPLLERFLTAKPR